MLSRATPMLYFRHGHHVQQTEHQPPLLPGWAGGPRVFMEGEGVFSQSVT